MLHHAADQPTPRDRIWLPRLGLLIALALILIGRGSSIAPQQRQTVCARQGRDILYRMLQAPSQLAWLDGAAAQINPVCATLSAPQPLLSNVFFQLGNQAWLVQAWAKAATAYREAIARDPGQAMPRRRLAEILLYRDQQPAAALAQLQQAQALAPRESYTYLVMAHAYLALNDPEQGLQAANQALAVTQTAYGFMVQGQMLTALARWPEAVASLRASIALDDSTAGAYLLLGNALQANGEPDAARAAWAEARRRDPSIMTPAPAQQ
jgi:tetratricopeptide (TPR) repeat protein